MNASPTLPRALDRIVAFWYRPDDTDEIKRRKQIFVPMTLMAHFVGLTLGTLQLALGFPTAALFPFALLLSFFLNLILLKLTGWLEVSIYMGFLTLLVLPPFNQWALGGFAASGAIMLWGISAPFGALIFADFRRALPMAVLYVSVCIFVLCLERFVPAPAGWPVPSAELSFWFLLFNFIGFIIFVFANVSRFARGQNEALDALDAEHRLLQREQERSERLLLNILPEPIARRLKEKPETIAEGFPEASVLFADIVGFTPLSTRMQPEELVHLLNEIFSRFDELADRHGLEKIKTIGDAYMAACGLPVPRPDHARACARMALDMRRALGDLRHPAGADLRLRIGINSGPVVAGVIGSKKFIYDLWGDAVNTASRMESQGRDGGIQITETVRLSLDDAFEIEERGMIDIKGKGPMKTFFLHGEKTTAA